MIINLIELRSYSEELARQFPRIADTIRIGRYGVTAEEIAVLEDTLKLPPIYKRCICEIGLFGVSVGYFSMWPGSIQTGNLVDSIRLTNRGDEIGKVEARNSHLIIVGQEEANLICVGGIDSAHLDVVYLLDVMRSSTVEQRDVAPDFECFLLLAGNLHEISCKYENNPTTGIEKMLECCDHFHCTKSQIAFWESRAEVMLS